MNVAQGYALSLADHPAAASEVRFTPYRMIMVLLGLTRGFIPGLVLAFALQPLLTQGDRKSTGSAALNPGFMYHPALVY